MGECEKKDQPKQKDKALGSYGTAIESKEALRVIHSHIDNMQKQLDYEFEKAPIITLDQERDHFICSNKFWDLWFQKLFAQLISVKVWVLVLITILLVTELITATVFGTLFGIIMGFKGAFQVAEVWTSNHNDMRSFMDKT